MTGMKDRIVNCNNYNFPQKKRKWREFDIAKLYFNTLFHIMKVITFLIFGGNFENIRNPTSPL